MSGRRRPPRALAAQIAEHRFIARELDDSVDAAWPGLPIEASLVQEQWSGAVVSTLDGEDTGIDEPSGVEGYQYPGLISRCVRTGRLSLCYGQGRLQDAFGPLPTVPLARIEGSVTEFAQACRAIQFAGETPLRLEALDEPADAGVDTSTEPALTLTLGDAEATAIAYDGPFLDRFLEALPLAGVATNTHTSGPLVRLWNADGGAEGRTTIAVSEAEIAAHGQALLGPGEIYYLPKPDVAGLRITTRMAAIMRPALGGAALKLVPIARITGDWRDFAERASGLPRSGAIEMTISVREAQSSHT